eukprot:TRINITY_DN14591_c0_g1_i1.p2 TRINITY_DN14591_c0_g1~~TRINITY_DN14591_c0_g1_i1.p2  ORF type:complete len:199 (+),score=38.83 TRINITY_DN14591_c0_g1_i1:129-725(+)
MSFTLEPLPYAKDALAPHISAETVEFHYEKHHRGYVTRLNGMVKDTPDANKTLDEIVRTSSGRVFNMAAQVWNHTFYWKSLKAGGGSGNPTGKLAEAISADFGSYDKFKEQFTEIAAGHFGSGWAWLVKNPEGKLEVVGTHDAGNPLTNNQTPILTCDVWEHAYYIDYRNDRPKYIDGWWSLVNWEFAEQNLSVVNKL